MTSSFLAKLLITWLLLRFFDLEVTNCDLKFVIGGYVYVFSPALKPICLCDGVGCSASLLSSSKTTLKY